MKILNVAISVMLGAVIIQAQPGMGPGMGQGHGHGHPTEERSRMEAPQANFHSQEIWMNERLLQELGFTEMQREKLRAFGEDTANGIPMLKMHRMVLQNTLVEAFQSSAVNEERLRAIQEDWIASESKWIVYRIKATRFFFSLLSTDQKSRLLDLHEKRKTEKPVR